MAPPPPPFTEEHEELRQSIRGFLERELAPHAQEWEEQRWFPNELFPRLAAVLGRVLQPQQALRGQAREQLVGKPSLLLPLLRVRRELALEKAPDRLPQLLVLVGEGGCGGAHWAI